MTASRTFALIDRRIIVGLGVLLLGHVFWWAGVSIIYVLALVFFLAVGLPYPRIFRSWLSRLAAAFLLALSLIQVAATVQFFVAPGSRFALLSFVTSAASAGLVWSLRNVPRQSWILLTRVDVAGIVAALFFALPLGVLCFWRNDPAQIAALASVQGVDGPNHYTAIAEMSKEQHLNYRTAEYYPKGFHLASAFLLHGLHANQPDQNWAANARTYMGMFIAWGAFLAYLVLYLAAQLVDHLRKKPSPLLLALAIGPILSLVYLFVFLREGFLSYYYICAAVVLAVMYLYDAKLDKRLAPWPVIAYLLLAFGIAMSWGPLLTIPLLTIPILYLWPHFQNMRALPRMLVSREWRWVALAFVAQLVPLYLHLRYAHLSSEQGINATGGLKIFHYGPFLAELGLMVYLLCGRVNDEWRRYASNVLLPFFVFVGAFVCLQYLTVGELRYYAIKSSLLLEIIALAVATVVLAVALYQSKISSIQRWLALPTAVIVGVVGLAGMTANPFNQAHIILGTLAHNAKTTAPTLRSYTDLGTSGKLSTNLTHVRYDEATGRLTGNAPVVNWANLMQYTTDGSAASGTCTGRIFALETYGTGAPAEQDQLTTVIKACIQAAADRHRPYFIVTDGASVQRLRETFGENNTTYIY